ncbi:MAG: bifunctional phosphoribosylaminoimidazolecarboxamide formyltransferase/IMP cyclohydrolase [Defluviitaleaceae bacterium]|nr:bifunctional phosphoribosylaminoimidazolecarboxamide formyltransferase/IMP cyclohydrolase [Defluviitaleaceae bacterium]MCL2837290.1 bifunctional phosphoribosylaminoimidazolecarboxamide formyltransferase/IMP cyclohydrolase [Defluviitaleaceae bacterium]
MKRALISVYDKTGIADFAKELAGLGYGIISTGGTYAALHSAGVANLLAVDNVTGSPEMLGGRVKTLHPHIHGGILADRENTDHMAELEKYGIGCIDIVVNNLYPFEDTETVENIDIGGPSMIRAAAKNHKHTAIITDPADYPAVLNELHENGGVCEETRLRLAAKAFAVTARFDALVAAYLRKQAGEDGFPDILNLTFTHKTDFSYGENPHQKAAFYTDSKQISGIACFKQLHGGPLSFNNINDTNDAVELLREFDEPAAVASKHTNPCGVGIGANLTEAFIKARNADPVSIYGGIIALNREVDEDTALQMKGILLDIVVAPSYTAGALEILSKKKGTRILELDMAALPGKNVSIDFKRVSGGIIAQETDNVLFPAGQSIERLPCVTARKPTGAEYDDLLFAWKIVKHVKSNAVVIAKNGQTAGIGCGQVNRVWAARQAIESGTALLGEDSLKNAALASDAFFPFEDCVVSAAEAGISAVIQPGGSIRDGDSIAACDENGIAMIFAGMRHFKH